MAPMKTKKDTLRNFGLTMALCLAVIALVLRHRTSPMAVLALLSFIFLLLALSAPASLVYFYSPWMKLAYCLSWFNTRVLLCLLFYLVFLPVGVIMRLCNIDPLERTFDRSCDSYWKPRDKKPFSPGDYEKRF
jgi:hypothetical protein